ncbi:MAG: PDZ domain-containing protein [Acidobacteria bacterium]|nr:PDZ domain-containing protein [Acidobacteriota bacterium]
MQTRIWLASTVAVACAVAIGAAATPMLDGQASADAVPAASTRVEEKVTRAETRAQRAVQDAVRDIDVVVDTALQGLPALMAGRPRLGISTRDVTTEEATTAGLSGITGALVADVSQDSAAYTSGIRTGDIIVSIDGERIRSARQLSRVVGESADGRALQVEYVRGTQKATATVTPDMRQMSRRFGPDADPFGPGRENDLVRRFERWKGDGADRFDFVVPGPGAESTRPRIRVGRGRLGVGVQAMPDQLATYFGVSAGVLVTQVAEQSAAGKAGIKAGDVITSVNGKPVTDAGDIFEHVSGVEAGKAVAVEVSRDRKRQTITVTMSTPSDSSNGRSIPRRPRFTA